jgi:ubiquinone/menaquinone biosynthesis C-methylase UbiE
MVNLGKPLFHKLFKRRQAPIQVDVLTGYAWWAAQYPARVHNRLMEIEEEAMLSLLPDLAGKICLDMACGSGRYMAHLQAGGARQVFGLDYSAEMLAQAKTVHSDLPVVRCPFLALPFAPETFDLITCGMGVGHERQLKRVLGEVARLLRPGGVAIYSDFHPFATLSGWQRTFTTEDGQVYSLEHYLHLYQDHQQACQAVGLTIDRVLEPAAQQVQPPFQEKPVVLAIRAVKTR